MRKLFWLILGWVPERQLSVGNFSRHRSANGCHYFFVSFILLSFHPGRQAINLTVSINLVNTFGPTPAFPWGPTLPNLSTPNRTPPWGSDISNRQSQHSRALPKWFHFRGQPHTPEHLQQSWMGFEVSWAGAIPAHYYAQSNHGPTTTGGYTKPTQETALEHLALVTKVNCATRPYKIPSTWGHSLKTERHS